MSEYIIRPMTIEDAHQGARLWSLVFGDAEAVVGEFFRLFAHTPTFGVCAEQSGTIVAAAYCPTGMDYITADDGTATGCYLYAVATHPDHRKHGLARKLCLQLRNAAWCTGLDYLFTKPSEESLYPWYAEKIDAIPCLGAMQAEFSATEAVPLPVETLTWADYMTLRGKHLRGTNHVQQNQAWMQWEQVLHDAYGGGFYAVGNRIADCYFDGKTLTVNELLPHPTLTEAEILCSSLMATLGGAKCKCTLWGEGHYVSAASKDGKLPPNGWFGNCYG